MASRANHVDFSLPYTDSGVTMLVPIKHNMHRSMWVFLKPLSLDLWLTTIAASTATGIVLLILEHNGRRESLQPLELLCLILRWSMSRGVELWGPFYNHWDSIAAGFDRLKNLHLAKACLSGKDVLQEIRVVSAAFTS